MASNVQGKDQLANDTYVQDSINPQSTTPATGHVASDNDVSSDDPAVGDSSNPIVNSLIDSVEGDELHNMSASKAPQKSDVSSAKFTDAGNASGNNDVGNVRGAGESATKITNQEGNINADLNHGSQKTGRV